MTRKLGNASDAPLELKTDYTPTIFIENLFASRSIWNDYVKARATLIKGNYTLDSLAVLCDIRASGKDMS
jgi:hypothetical protein